MTFTAFEVGKSEGSEIFINFYNDFTTNFIDYYYDVTTMLTGFDTDFDHPWGPWGPPVLRRAPARPSRRAAKLRGPWGPMGKGICGQSCGPLCGKFL